MSHVDDGTLHALVDNELDANERSAVEAHLASCGECARRFADATAMARQVMSLLGALDEQPTAVRITPPPVTPAVAPDPTIVPIRSRLRTLRRVALAASVLVVAGVSYQVGRSRDPAAPAVAVSNPGGGVAPPARRLATPSVVEAAPDSYVAAAAPSVRLRPRGGPRPELESPLAERVDAAGGATGNAAPAPAPAAKAVALPLTAPSLAAAPTEPARKVSADAAPASQTASQAAPASVARVQVTQAPAADRAEQSSERRARVSDAGAQGQRAQQAAALAQSPAPGAPGRTSEIYDSVQQVTKAATAPAAKEPLRASGQDGQKPPTLAGYTALDEESLPSITRRRYVSANGTAILLLITQPLAEGKVARERDGAPEFVVSTTNGRSTVRWHARGRDYELQGALAPDSLVKLATLLR